MRRPLAALLSVLAAVLPVLLAAAPAAGAEPVRVLVDGAPLALDVPAQIIADRVMVPLRKVFEALGAQLDWNPADGSISARSGERWVWLTVGSQEARVDGRVVALDVPALLVDDRTLVPARFVSEALGATVVWDGATRTVSITTAPAPGGRAGRERSPTAAGGALEVDGPVPEQVAADLTAQLPGLWAAVADALAPVPDPQDLPRVVLVADRDRWLQRLLAEGTEPSVASQIATHAVASAGGDRIHVLVDDPAGDYRTVLAHELTHVATNRRRGTDRMPEWLSEGLAELTARTVAGRDPRSPLGSRDLAGVRKAVLDRAAQGTLEPLFAAYGEWIDRFDDYPLYSQALLATALLVERWGGMAAVRAYLDGLGGSVGHDAAFRGAFGIAPDEFEAIYMGYLYGEAQRAVPRVTVTLRVPEGRFGQLAVFAPGGTESPGWHVTGPATLTVTAAPDGTVQVQGPVARRATWTLAEPQTVLAIYFIPDEPVPLGERQVVQAAIVLAAEYGAWYWSQNTAYFAENVDPASSRDDPAFPVGVELVELGG